MVCEQYYAELYLFKIRTHKLTPLRHHIHIFTFMLRPYNVKAAHTVEVSDIRTCIPCPLASGAFEVTCLLAAHTHIYTQHTKIWSMHLWSLRWLHILPGWNCGKSTLEEEKAGKLGIPWQIPRRVLKALLYMRLGEGCIRLIAFCKRCIFTVNAKC